MKTILCSLVTLLCFGTLCAQQSIGLSVKSNLLNLLAKRPSFAVEKTFNNRYGVEVAYASGELNWGRTYEFDGLLVRGKVYAYKIKAKNAIPYYGLYTGFLNKRIISYKSYVHPTGFLSYGSNRDYKANSYRAGANFGILFIPKKAFFIEPTTSLGYGRYYNVQTFNGSDAPTGYFDFQLNLSVGYSF